MAIDDADRTENLACETGALARHPDVVAFCDRNLRRPDLTRFHHAGETQGEQLRLRDLLHHPDELFLDHLEAGNRAAELLPLFRVGKRRLITIDPRGDDTPG